MPKVDLQAYLAARDPLASDPLLLDRAALERSFERVIAEPLTHALPAAPARGARSLPRIAKVAAPVAAAAATALVLTTGGGAPGGAFPAAVAELADAASSPSAVLHTVVTGDDVDGAPGARREQWSTVDGATIRYRTTQPSGTFTDVLLRTDTAGRRHLLMYRSATDTLYRYAPSAQRAEPASTASISIDHLADYTKAVRAGTARVTGEETVRGVRAYRVEQDVRGAVAGAKQVWLVSEDADRPRLLRIERPCAPAEQPCEATDFATYEITDDRAALAMPEHAGAKVVDVERPDAP